MYSTTIRQCVLPVAASLFIGFIVFGSSLVRANDGGSGEAVDRILATSLGSRGGLVVHYGCENADVLVRLAGDPSRVVEGLSRNPDHVQQSRDRLHAKGLCDRASVRLWQRDFLPYADGLVNALIISGKPAFDRQDMLRVLAPGGVALCTDRSSILTRPMEKPWPEEIDQWTHWLHGADGNPVAQDRRVGPPRSIQWISDPRWSKSHDASPSLTGMVTAGGRLFYIADIGPAGISDPEHHFENWYLCARDAFNGILLWKQPIEHWGTRAWSPGRFPESAGRYAGLAHLGNGPWVNNPRVIHKRLVAHGDHVYATLGFHAPVARLDAGTGKIVRTYERTEFTSEIILHDGVLFLTVDRAAQRAGTYVDRPAKSVVAIDPDSGRLLWEREGLHGVVDGKYRLLEATLTRLSLIAGDDAVFIRDQDAVIALDARTGEQRWQTPTASLFPENPSYFRATDPVGDLLYHDGVVFSWQVRPERGFLRPIELLALSSDDGSVLWKKDCSAGGFRSMVSVYAAQGLVWAIADPTVDGSQPGTSRFIGMDPRTGKVVKSHNVTPIMKTTHHHRCYRNKATENFVIFSRNGLEFTDLATGDININRWVRGICAYGIMPANGLTYAPPQQCICYANARVPGFVAYGGTVDQATQHIVAEEDRLLEGPAHSDIPPSSLRLHPSAAWPMYRHDGLRSAATQSQLPNDLSATWKRDLGEPVTAPTLGWRKLFLGAQHTRRILALDAASGKTVWEAAVDNRVDTPPTLSRGRVYFGTLGGYVYCLRADDGQLVWRFNANPAYRSIVVRGNVESAWPVHGSVVVSDGSVYFSAGRSSYVDGGLRFYALDAVTGQLRLSAGSDTADAECQDAGANPQGAFNDLLVHDGRNLYLKNLRLDTATFAVESSSWPYTPFTKSPWEKDFVQSPLVCMTEFLDDSLYDRSAYVLNQRHSARMLVFNDDLLFGVDWSAVASQENPGRLLHHRGLFEIGRNQYAVFARAFEKGDLWRRNLDLRIGAMVLAGDTLVVAGTPMTADGTPSVEFALRAVRGEEGGKLLRLSISDGTMNHVCPLPAPPVWNGVAVSKQGLFLTLRGGSVMRLGREGF